MTNDSSPRILGIDPGLNITGYGVIEVAVGGPKIVEAGIIRGKTKGSLSARVLEIYRGVSDVVATFQPSVMALEQLYSHYNQPRTAILMGHARGVICMAAAEAGLKVIHLPATRIKKMLTGNGHAKKFQMQLAIQRQWNLAAVPEPPDVADALAVALCHYYQRPEWVAIGRSAG